MIAQKKWAAARSIQSELERHGYEAVIVGGAVRDLMLGREPGDVDVATEAEPHIVKQVFKKTADVGIEHGTIMVLHPDHPVEVTTYRTEGTYTDHRRPDHVDFVKSLEEDLKRRDFTINALAMNSAGAVIDYFAGKKDIEDRIIRCVGNPEERFAEDALRMLRAVRFASQLNFQVEQETLTAIQQLAHSISYIAVERIKVELDKIFLSKHPEIGIRLLLDTGLASYLPVLQLKDFQRNSAYWKKFRAFNQSVNGWAFINLLTGANQIDEIVRSYKLSNSEKRSIRSVTKAVLIRKTEVWNPLHYYHFSIETIRVAERFASILSSTVRVLSEDALEEGFRTLPIRTRSEIVVNGNDLIGWSGKRGGPWVKEWLNELEKAIVLKRVNNDREEIREWFLREFINE